MEHGLALDAWDGDIKYVGSVGVGQGDSDFRKLFLCAYFGYEVFTKLRSMLVPCTQGSKS